jgi:glycosyltransferase involved in cell wall biosynthesis
MKVLLFNHAFFFLSETFIYKQVTGIPADVHADLLAYEILNENHFPLSNRKIQVRRRKNVADRIVTAIRKRIFNVHYRFSVSSEQEVKHLLKTERYDVIHAHFGFNALLMYPLAKALNIPLVITFHGLDASPEWLKKKQYREKLQAMLDYASAIIVVSPHMKDTLGLHDKLSKTHLIPCGVDPTEFAPEAHASDNGRITFLHSGRLVSKKGVPDLVRVFSALSHKYASIYLTIIGDGPELDNCRLLAKEARAGSIRLLGAKPHYEVKRAMADSDIFVLNSRVGASGDMEGMPVSLLEAMSMQLAVVSTRHAGIPEAIDDGNNGLLVNEKDNDALGAAFEKLIVSEEFRKRLGVEARRTVVNRFTMKQTNQKIAAVYRSVAAR